MSDDGKNTLVKLFSPGKTGDAKTPELLTRKATCAEDMLYFRRFLWVFPTQAQTVNGQRGGGGVFFTIGQNEAERDWR